MAEVRKQPKSWIIWTHDDTLELLLHVFMCYDWVTGNGVKGGTSKDGEFIETVLYCACCCSWHPAFIPLQAVWSISQPRLTTLGDDQQAIRPDGGRSSGSATPRVRIVFGDDHANHQDTHSLAVTVEGSTSCCTIHDVANVVLCVCVCVRGVFEAHALM